VLNPNEANAAYGYDTNVNYPKGVGPSPSRKLHRVIPPKGEFDTNTWQGFPPSSAAWISTATLRDYPAKTIRA